jgi:hypothetical protein
MTHDRDKVLDRIEELEARYLDGEHDVAGELAELYDADKAPKASRIWNVLAGQAKAPQRTKETSMSKTTKTTDIADPKATLAAYLKAEVTSTEVGTVELPAPYLTKAGNLHVHSRHMTKWAKAKVDRKVEQADVQRALRSLGLKVRAVAMPGLGKSAGFYVGKPKGVSLKGLPVRELEGRDRDGQRQVERSAGLHVERAVELHLRHDPRGLQALRRGHQHRLSVGVDQVESHLVLDVPLVPGDLHVERDGGRRRAGPGDRPAAAVDVELPVRHVGVVGQQHRYLQHSTSPRSCGSDLRPKPVRVVGPTVVADGTNLPAGSDGLTGAASGPRATFLRVRASPS